MRKLRFVVVSSLAVACHGASGSPSYSPPPASVVVDDAGPLKIRRELLLVDGVAPPPNPKTGASTPPAQNKVRVVRYRLDAEPPRPARAVVVMMPGTLGGAGSMDGLARALVRRSAPDDALEAWVVDRRSNLLEDTHGLDVAEALRDPSQARRYYLDGAEVYGETFAGYLQGVNLSWASEWGIATTVGDLRQIVARVPEAERARRVILLGHSLGAEMVEEYAAWDFGAPGTSEIAGLVLADGLTGIEGKGATAVDRARYEQGGAPSPDGFGQTLGVVSDIRDGNVFYTLPVLGVKAEVVAEYAAMSARFSPDAVEADPARDSLLAVLLGLSPAPKLSNRAAFGFAFDDDSCGLTFAAIACGSGAGGAITPYADAFGGTHLHPSDPAATYGWRDYDAVTPREATAIDDAARAWYEGPGLNFAEWYFPNRLAVDADAAGTLDIADDDWRSAMYGMRAKYGARIDVPILAEAFALVKDVAEFEPLRAMVAPIGAGRPAAGRGRGDRAAFETHAHHELTHVDLLLAADAPGSPAAAWYDELAAFARAATLPGGVVLP